MKYYFLGLLICFLSNTCVGQNATNADSSRGTNAGNQADSLDNTDKIVFIKTEVEAQFPGGDPAWAAYLRGNLNPNTPVVNGAPKGTYRVIIRFIVSKDGTISDAVAETKNGFGMENEAIRIIKNGPGWIPAIQNGRKVNAYRRQPISFIVN